MFIQYLKELNHIATPLQIAKKSGEKIINLAVFDEQYLYDLKAYKKIFLGRFLEKRQKLQVLQEKINHDVLLVPGERNILQKEIVFEYSKIQFLEDTYDISARQIDEDFQGVNKEIDYDYYNRLFWGVSKLDLNKEFKIISPKIYNIFFSQKELKELLLVAKTLIPQIHWRFGNFPNLAFNGGWLKIPHSHRYHIKDVIALFFHEMTHFFRYHNTKRNLGIMYSFSDYPTLEEGIAIYNEHLYGNKIIDYGVYNPFYDICYKIILEPISETKKIRKIQEILAHKGYSQAKSKDYYERFYKFSEVGSKQLYLKDLVYSKSYDIVSDMIRENSATYKNIMSGRVGIQTMKESIVSTKNNLDSDFFFKRMVQVIQSKIEAKDMPKKVSVGL